MTAIALSLRMPGFDSFAEEENTIQGTLLYYESQRLQTDEG